MAFGCMVGWGTFVMPGTTFLPVAGPAGTILAMGIGILVMLMIGWNVSYLMIRSPVPAASIPSRRRHSDGTMLFSARGFSACPI